MTSKSYTDLYYPYQVHEPEKTVSSPPAIMFLHGHGSRGDKSAVNENVYWDGVGWLLREYSKGNKTGTNVIAAEQYLTILPLMPLTDDDWIASHTMEVMKAVLAKYSSIDKARVHVGGYSRGGWGSWRTAFASPTTFASCIPAAGSGGFTDDQLKSLVTAKVPVWAWAGDSDTKVPKAQVESTVDQMKKISGAVVQITVIHGDHTTMSKEPWVEPQTWEWIANQNRDGSPAASSSNSSSLGNSSSTSLDDSSGSISTSGGSSSGSQTLKVATTSVTSATDESTAAVPTSIQDSGYSTAEKGTAVIIFLFLSAVLIIGLIWLIRRQRTHDRVSRSNSDDSDSGEGLVNKSKRGSRSDGSSEENSHDDRSQGSSRTGRGRSRHRGRRERESSESDSSY